MDSDSTIVNATALFSSGASRLSNSFQELVEQLTKELKAHKELIDRLEQKITDLEQKGSQSVSIKIDGDVGERLDELEQRLNDELHSEEDIREWARDEAQEVLSNTSFEITVNQ